MPSKVTQISEHKPETQEYRTPPGNEEAEQALLGALLINNTALEKIVDFLKAEHFLNPVHGRIYNAILTISERGQNADPITLKNYFERDEDLIEIGGAQYLVDLAAGAITIISSRDYAEDIHSLYLKRSLINLGEEMVNTAYQYDLEISASDEIESAEQKLYKLAETGTEGRGFTKLHKSLAASIKQAQAAHKRDNNITGVTSGLLDVDKKLGGLQPSDLIILAGRPSMGKTALGTNFAYNAAEAYLKSGGKEGGKVGFFSLEMSSEQLATRILASASNVPSDKIRRGEVHQEDFVRFAAAQQELANTPLFIDDTPGLSIQAIRTRARRLKRQHGLDMIVVDYLQLLRGARSQAENRVLEISEITRGLKALAKDLEIPVIALSQLSRAVEQRDDKRPQLSDLRESGSIEQDADVVMFIYREEYYLGRTQPTENTPEHEIWQEKMEKIRGKAELIVAKQRHGPIGTIPLIFNGRFTHFDNYASHHQDFAVANR